MSNEEDLSLLPLPLRAYYAAIEIGVMRVDHRATGAAGALDASLVNSGGVHAETGVCYPNYIETGMYIRLDLAHCDIPRTLATKLRQQYSSLLGADGALYEHERATLSQYSNRAIALVRLSERIQSALEK